MVGPVRFDGLSSGIDYTSIIEKLLAIQKRPIEGLQAKAVRVGERRAALQQVSSSLLGLKSIVDNLARPSFFARTRVSSSNESILKASGDAVASLGAYSFTVKRLAQSHQLVSNGFADQDTTAVTSVDSTLRVELGGGHLDRRTPISLLNAGAGIDRGSIKITDTDGNLAVVNLEHVTTVQDVLDAINNNTQVEVQASVTGDRIDVRDEAGGAGTLKVENFGADTTATSLGLDVAAIAVGGTQHVFGRDINFATGATSLDLLNDRLGVRTVSGDDLRIVTRNAGAVFDVDLNSTMTLSDVVNAINTDGGNPGTVTASLSPDGTRILLDDSAAFAARTVDASTATSLTDAAIAGLPANSLVGARVKVLSTGDVRRITAYDPGTGEITVDSAWSVAPGAGSEYRIAFSVGPANSGFAAADLGLATVDPATGRFFTPAAENPLTGALDEFFEANSASSRVVGHRFLPELNSTLRTLLRGGQTNTTAGELKGIRDGTVTFTDRSGASTTINLSARVGTTVSAVVGPTELTLASTAGFAVGNRIRVFSTAGVEERTVIEISGLNVKVDKPFTGAIAVGNGAFAVNDSLEDILRNANDRLAAAGVDIRLGHDPEGNGVLVTDFSGGSGLLTVADATGSVASDLGIDGAVSANTINGEDLDAQWLSERTTLASLNGATGVQAGKFRVTDTNGTQFEVDLSQADDVNLGEVIRDGNGSAVSAGSGVRFRINDAGDGLLIEDTTPGAGTLRIEEVGGGRTARDLNILGSAPSANPDTIDGSFEISVTVKAGSKLKDVAAALNAAGIPIQASVINDGSPVNPFRITLLSKRSGEAGRLVVDSDMPAISFATSAAAQNSLLLYGSNGGATDPVVISSSGNTVSNVVSGLTLNLLSPSDTDVTVTVDRDLESVEKQAAKLAETYNSIIQKIRDLTFFNPSTLEKGPLFADPTVRRIEQELQSLINKPVNEIASGDLNSLSSVGFKMTKEGGIAFDSSVFKTALQDKFSQVETLFTLQRKLKVDTPLSDFNRGQGVQDFEGDDFEIFTRRGTKKISVDMAGIENISALLAAINNDPANGGDLVASISADGFSLQIDDATTVPDRTVEGPTTLTTFNETDPEITGLAANFLVGATVTFLTGANAGEVRKVTASSGSLITLDENLVAAPAAGDLYRIERELEVRRVGDATAAAEMKLEKKAELGQNVLKGGLINLDRDPGIAPRFSEKIDSFTKTDGLISTKTDSLDDIIADIEKSVERIETRVNKMQERLVREFARLEMILAESRSTMSRLQTSLSSFVGMLSSSVKK